MNNTKICIKCKEEKPETKGYFYFRKDNNKFRNECKECFDEKNLNYYFKNKDKFEFKETRKISNKNWRNNNLERAKQNNINFYINNPTYNKQYYNLHKEVILEKQKIYIELNKENLTEYQIIYRKLNKTNINKQRMKKYYSDKDYKILVNLRTRINLALKNNFKSGKTLKLLGCSIDFLKNYLESKFKPGMSWDNHGVKGWHIDHIYPCSSFDLSKPSEQKICFHWSNLQPLWAEENLKKSNKI